jgi:histidyl-tRNA synthetase
VLRQADIPTELYSEKAKLSEQLRYANKKGFKLVIIAGEEEFSQATVQIKNMVSGQQITCPLTDLVNTVHIQLNNLAH